MSTIALDRNMKVNHIEKKERKAASLNFGAYLKEHASELASAVFTQNGIENTYEVYKSLR